MIHAQEARWTLSLSPAALILAGLDRTLHLANAPVPPLHGGPAGPP
jgi:hypothetical protein